MKKVLLLAIFMVFSLLASFSVAGPSLTSLDGITITSPDSSSPPEIKAFYGLSGKWKGNWEGHVRNGYTYSGPGYFVIRSIDVGKSTAGVLVTKSDDYEGELAFKVVDGVTKLEGVINNLQFEFWIEDRKLKARSFSKATAFAEFEPIP